MSDLMEQMRALQKGEVTVEDVAAEFRTRRWPTVSSTPDDADDAFAAMETDREPDPPGAFSEVAGAFYQGIITIDQYGVLAEAAAEGIRAGASAPPPADGEDTGGDNGGDNDPTEPVTEEEPEKDEPAGQSPDAETEGGDKPEDTDGAEEDPDKPKPGKPKKGVNPFPKKGS